MQPSGKDIHEQASSSFCLPDTRLGGKRPCIRRPLPAVADKLAGTRARLTRTRCRTVERRVRHHGRRRHFGSRNARQQRYRRLVARRAGGTLHRHPPSTQSPPPVPDLVVCQIPRHHRLPARAEPVGFGQNDWPVRTGLPEIYAPVSATATAEHAGRRGNHRLRPARHDQKRHACRPAKRA